MPHDHGRGGGSCGAGFPGVISAGWYYKEGRHVFWDVVNPQNTVAFDLADKGYSQLIVEVADPDAAVSLIRDATRQFSSLRVFVRGRSVRRARCTQLGRGAEKLNAAR
jgi:hypothetical protein